MNPSLRAWIYDDPHRARVLRVTTPSLAAWTIKYRAVRNALLVFAVVAVASGCAATGAHINTPAAQGDAQNRIYVVRHDKHTGIVVSAADVPENAWPARREFATAKYLEVGWGDRAYYQAADPGLLLGLRALFWPAPGVLHIVAFSDPVELTFGASEILELRVSGRGFEQLVAMIRDSHELDESGRPIAFGPGRYGTSRFYASREKFHLFKTCNVWTATLLRETGVPVSAAPALTAGNLMSQLRPRGRLIRSAP